MAAMFHDLPTSHRRVLDIIWRDGPSSRADIARRTGFTRPAISQMVQELSDQGLLVEQAARRGGRGQPSRPLVMRAEAGFTVGVNFSHSYLDLCLVDLSGAMIETARRPLVAATAEAIGAVAAPCIAEMIDRHGLSRERLLGVGISLPGDFARDGGRLPHPMFADLAGPDLGSRFNSSFGMDVMLENDGRTCAIGERVIGVGAAYRTFMLVHIGHGVGGGIMIDGKPYRGALGNAGILGQFYPYGAPRPSGQDLLETLEQAGFGVADFDGLENLASASQGVVATWVERAAAQLARELACVGRFFGPEAIILTGRLPPAIMTSLVEAIDLGAVLPPTDMLPNPPLLASRLGSAAGMVGAATLPIFRSLLPHA